MAYEKDKDYQAIINEAAAKGDYVTAAKAEQSRNEKIKSEGLDYKTTSNYAGWLDTTDYGTIGKQQMAAGASAQDVLNTYNSRYNKAANTVGLTQYANDAIQQEMWDYINKNPVKVDFNYNVAQPTYNSSYGSKIDKLLKQILNRDAFSYDVADDPLYQQYREQYNREGNRSMNDTLAAAASSAGGMNSYAITAAQQASDYYAAQLNDKIPELYQLAYEMYLTDIDNQVRDLGLLQQMDNTQYDRYRDQMADWRADRDFAYGMYRDDVGDNKWKIDYDYGVSRDTVDDEHWDKNYILDTKDDAWDRAMTIILNGGTPSAELLKAAGMTEAEAKSLKDAQIVAAPAGGGYGSGSGGSGGSGGGSGGSGGSGKKGDGGDAVPTFNNKPTGGDFIDTHGAAVANAPDRTSFDTSDLSANGKKALSSLSMMYDSMNNQYVDAGGMYPVERSIVDMYTDKKITADDGYILMEYFGYDGDKHFPDE